MVETLHHEDFAPHVNKAVRFRGWGGTLRLASIRLAPEGSDAPELMRPPFAVIFHGPRHEILPEGLYVADIEDGPSFEFYIAPVHTPAPDRQDYQAVFN